MKRQMVGFLSCLTLSIVAVPLVQAETVEVKPFQLVSLAQEGYFENQGIPKGGTFLDEYQSGRITIEDIIRAAIEDKRLSEDTLNDREYINSVRVHIRALSEDGSN